MPVLQILRKTFVFCISIVTVIVASAQITATVVAGTVSETAVAELWVSKIENNKQQRIADFTISPAQRNFMFSIPGDSIATYRLQVNLMKTGKHHPEIERVRLISFNLDPHNNYSLKITPSKLDSSQKKGWDLKTRPGTPQYALVKGNIAGTNFNVPIIFNTVVNGQLEQGNRVVTDNHGNFSIPVHIHQDGFYYLSSPRWRVRLYLHPNEKLQLTVDNKTGLITSVGSHGSNELLFRWQQLIAPITNYGYNLSLASLDSFNLNAYMVKYRELQPAMEQFMESFDFTDQREYQCLHDAMATDMELAPINLLFQLSAKKAGIFRATPKEFNIVPDFYNQFIQPRKFGNTSLLVLGETRQFMKLYALMNLGLVPKEKRETLSKAEKLRLMMNTISNDTLKSFFFKDQMEAIEINNLSEFKETFEPFKNYAKFSPAKDTYKSIYGLFSGDTAFIGKSSYNFSLPDTSGSVVSMKDFKGKVVLIDVWATWCGPCRAQFPFLKEIEEQYAGNKDIVFVGISLDKADARQKWADMIKKEKLGGVQLLDDFGKSFGRKYDISAIPRFLLIDKQGRWIEIRCPLPENKQEFKRYLDRALSE